MPSTSSTWTSTSGVSTSGSLRFLRGLGAVPDGPALAIQCLFAIKRLARSPQTQRNTHLEASPPSQPFPSPWCSGNTFPFLTCTCHRMWPYHCWFGNRQLRPLHSDRKPFKKPFSSLLIRLTKGLPPPASQAFLRSSPAPFPQVWGSELASELASLLLASFFFPSALMASPVGHRPTISSPPSSQKPDDSFFGPD